MISRSWALLASMFMFGVVAGCDSANDLPPDGGGPADTLPDFSGSWFGSSISETESPRSAGVQLVAVRDSANLYEATFALQGDEMVGEAEFFAVDSTLVLYELVPGVGRRTRAELMLIEGSPNQLRGETIGTAGTSLLFLESVSRDGEGPVPPEVRAIEVVPDGIIMTFDQNVELVEGNYRLFSLAATYHSPGTPSISAEGSTATVEFSQELPPYPMANFYFNVDGIVGSSGLALVDYDTTLVYGQNGAASVALTGDLEGLSFEGGTGSFYHFGNRTVIYACNTLFPFTSGSCMSLTFDDFNGVGEYNVGSGIEGIFCNQGCFLEAESGTATIAASSDDRVVGTFDYVGDYNGVAVAASGSFEAIRASVSD